MDYQTLALLFLALGFALIIAEVFIPSGGILLVSCVLTFCASLWYAYKAWFGTNPSYFWTHLASMIILIPGFVVGLFRLLDRTSLGDRIMLNAPTSEEVIPYRAEAERLANLIGQQGVALTLMTPGGLVKVGHERLHCVSEGMLVEAGECVEIIGVQGTRVLVRKVDKSTRPRLSEQTDSPFLSDFEDNDQPRQNG